MVVANRSDEIGSLGRSLESFRATLEAREGDVQRHVFRSAAFFGASSPITMVNRDLVIVEQNFALREFMAQLGVRSRVAVATVGKVKTVAQMVAIGMMLYGKPLGAKPPSKN